MIRFLRWKRIGSRKSTLRLPRSCLQNSRPRKAVRLRKLIPPWVNAQASPSRLGISVGPWATGIVKDRKSVVEGKRVSVSLDPGGRRIIKKKKKKQYNRIPQQT